MPAPRDKTNTAWRRLGPLLGEAALIVFSVLLGLMANEWRVAQVDEREADAALQAIRAELQRNHEEVQGLLPYHRRMSDSLAVLVERIYEGLGAVSHEVLFQAMPRGFSVPLIERNAWDVANRTGTINHIDFDLASALSQLYGLQAFYQGKLDLIGQNWYVAGNITPENLAATAIALGSLANDIVIQEERLSEQYPTMIERLGSR